MTETQPKYLEASYTAFQTFDLEEILEDLGLVWSKIDSYGIKWGNLFLITKDGKTHEWKGGFDPVDYKRPDEIQEYDEDYNVCGEE